MHPTSCQDKHIMHSCDSLANYCQLYWNAEDKGIRFLGVDVAIGFRLQPKSFLGVTTSALFFDLTFFDLGGRSLTSKTSRSLIELTMASGPRS